MVSGKLSMRFQAPEKTPVASSASATQKAQPAVLPVPLGAIGSSAGASRPFQRLALTAAFHLWTPRSRQRENVGISVARGRMLSSVRPLGRQETAAGLYMGVRGPGPDHPKRARSTVESPGCPSPVSPTVAPYSPSAHPYALAIVAGYAATAGVR